MNRFDIVIKKNFMNNGDFFEKFFTETRDMDGVRSLVFTDEEIDFDYYVRGMRNLLEYNIVPEYLHVSIFGRRKAIIKYNKSILYIVNLNNLDFTSQRGFRRDFVMFDVDRREKTYEETMAHFVLPCLCFCNQSLGYNTVLLYNEK